MTGDVARVGDTGVDSRQRRSPPVKFETDSRFKFDRSVALGSRKTCRESAIRFFLTTFYTIG